MNGYFDQLLSYASILDLIMASNGQKWCKKVWKCLFSSLSILRDQKIAILILVQRLVDRSSILDLTTLSSGPPAGEFPKLIFLKPCERVDENHCTRRQIQKKDIIPGSSHLRSNHLSAIRYRWRPPRSSTSLRWSVRRWLPTSPSSRLMVSAKRPETFEHYTRRNILSRIKCYSVNTMMSY